MTEIEVPDWVVEAAMRAEDKFYAEKNYGSFSDIQGDDAAAAMRAAINAALGAWVVHEGWKYEGLYPNVLPFRKDRADGYTAPLFTLRQEKPE